MNEKLVNDVNTAFEHLMARVEHEIKSAPVEQLEHVAHVLLQIMDSQTTIYHA